MNDLRDKRRSDDVSAQNRMATLLLLAKGQAPSLSRLRKAHQQKAHQQQLKQQSQQRGSSIPPKAAAPRRRWIILTSVWMIAVCSNVLLFPAYKSTDFFVHRHWKAVTRHLPVSQWYYDDRHAQTVHTLDYPPGFAITEYLLANNPLTNWVLLRNDGDQDDCLALKDDATVYATTSPRCVAYMRGTVIASDTLWWLGSYVVSTAAAAVQSSSSVAGNNSNSCDDTLLLFLLLAFHPALLWLDHVHFQYNGMLLGILLISIGCLMHANKNDAALRATNNNKNANNNSKTPSPKTPNTHFFHLAAAATFALLLTLKHLYLTNSLWYAVYLFRRYCCVCEIMSESSPTTAAKSQLSVVWRRFLALATVSGVAAVAPCLAFVGALLYRHAEPSSPPTTTTFLDVVAAWTSQVVSRLFPFGRGLVHTYWAGNVWALYTVAVKVMTVVATRAHSELLLLFVKSVSTMITPGFTAACMIFAQLPGLHLAWQAAAERSNTKLLQSFTLTALAAFLFQYHAHEKAILTALVPCTVWAFFIVADASERQQRPMNDNDGESKNNAAAAAAASAWSFLWEFTALSLLGLCPLLHQPQELPLKVCSYVAYLAVLQSLAPITTTTTTTRNNNSNSRSILLLLLGSRRPTQRGVIITGIVAATTAAQLELAPLGIFGRYEFVPLALTSLVCALGFVLLFVRLCYFRTVQ